MLRRHFLKSFGFLAGGLVLPSVAHANSHKTQAKSPQYRVLQTSPIAGFQYYQGEKIWTHLSTGQEVKLVRETSNPHDKRAVMVECNRQKLGYIPRMDNAAVSQLLDRGERIEAVISQLRHSDNPWHRVEVEVRWNNSLT